jgi:hypothetical protein
MERILQSLNGNFRQKNYFAEDAIDGTNGNFRRNSGCSAEQKTVGIPYRTILRKRKMLGISKYVPWNRNRANFQNFVPEHFTEQI